MSDSAIALVAISFGLVGTIAAFVLAHYLGKLNRYAQIGIFFGLVVLSSILKENGLTGPAFLCQATGCLLIINAITRRVFGGLASFSVSKKTNAANATTSSDAPSQRSRMRNVLGSISSFFSSNARVVIGIVLLAIGITARAYYAEGNNVDFGYFLGWLALLGGLALLLKPIMKVGASAWFEAQKSIARGDVAE